MAVQAMARVRPSAAEVKNMLLKIKMDNARRGNALAAMNANSPHDHTSCGINTAPFSFHGGDSCGGAHYTEYLPDQNKCKNPYYIGYITNQSGAQNDTMVQPTITNYDHLMPLHRNLHLFSSLGTTNALVHPDCIENCGSEQQPVKTAFEEMGSFTSMSKIIPATDADKDIKQEFRCLGDGQRGTEKDEQKYLCPLDAFLDYCSKGLVGQPEPISRKWRKALPCDHINAMETPAYFRQENIRVLQWNVLSQTLGTKNDNFVRCPKSALDWKTRRFRMLEEIARHDADVVCLQEVDHFPLVKEALNCLGYDGHFFPKPDSPCLYLPENSGPDGCAIFYKRSRFDLEKLESRVIEVWSVQSNQVVLSTVLKSKLTDSKVIIATTHLKARNGALLSTLRNEQGKDLLAYLDRISCNGKLPVICTGDFNAEPTEPVYQTLTDGNENISFESAYAEVNMEEGMENKKEPKYTTWKIREDGEHIQTLDYIFYHSPSTKTSTDTYSEDVENENTYDRIDSNSRSFPHPVCSEVEVENVLDFPSGEQISADRVPSFAYASDHFSLVADFKLRSRISQLEE